MINRIISFSTDNQCLEQFTLQVSSLKLEIFDKIVFNETREKLKI